MRTIARFGLTIVMVLGLCELSLAAGQESGSSQTQPKVGVVKKVDAVANTIVVMVAREMTFTVVESTKIHQGGDAKGLADIRIGANVQVEYTRTGDDRIATNIAILAAHEKSAETQAKVGVGDRQVTVDVHGQQRTCFVHVPPTYAAGRSLPLVIALHGSRGSGKGMASTTGFDVLAEQLGFIAAYPDGIVEPRSWNSMFGTIPGGEGVTADDVDDVAFIRALIDLLHASYGTDPNRVFVCGLSSGAHMSYRLAVELSDRIAAVGIVNGSLGIKSRDGRPASVQIPQPIAPVSLIHICGKKDGVVKFQGSQTPKGLFKSVPDCIRFFVEANGCAAVAKSTNDVAPGISRTRYSGGKAGTEMELVVIDNCGHEWSGDRHGLSASRALWSFFSAHPKRAK